VAQAPFALFKRELGLGQEATLPGMPESKFLENFGEIWTDGIAYILLEIKMYINFDSTSQ
jgi:hypothetical protein